MAGQETILDRRYYTLQGSVKRLPNMEDSPYYRAVECNMNRTV